MAGKPAPRTIRLQRHQFALEHLANGTPFCEVVALIAGQWGCSRRQAQNVARAALAEIAGTIEQIDLVPLLGETIHRLQRIADRAEKAGQYAAAVGAVKALHEFAIAPHYAGGQASARHGRSRF